MKKKTFKAELMAGHKEDALELPFDPSETWGREPKPLWRGRRGYEVQATVNGFSFESCVLPRQKKFFMLVSDDVKKATRVAVGDVVKATVVPLSD